MPSERASGVHSTRRLPKAGSRPHGVGGIMKDLLYISALTLTLCACSAHNPFIVTSTTDVKPAAARHYPAYVGPVLVVAGPLPSNARFEMIGEIEIGKVWYGGADRILQELADRARELGADAVIDVKTWHQPSGYSWAAPHGHGQAVKLLNPEELHDLSALGKML